jgi:hypothetical protein
MAQEIVYCREHNFVLVWREGVAYDSSGQRRDDVRADTCFSCGKGFLVSDTEGYPQDCPHCNAVL